MNSDSEKTVLYLRGVPRKLVREAKAAAARQGRTVASLTCNALASALGTSEEAGAAGALEGELAWYQQNRERLLGRYAGQYLAIVDRAVIDHDADFGALAERVFKKLGSRPIFMPRLTRDFPTPRMRSPRVIHE